ncbi:FAD-dependent oxidoreductase [Nitrospira sp. T9]|uniref:FAD-dependent oxidoreductase n=1 Tax=unclassified Nitrospira TaxID=2652172 RepID=UPI003F986AB5
MNTKWEVVILGGGFAGLACAKRFEKLWGPETVKRVLLISAENYFVYQPFLSEVIGAGIEPRHVMNPIRLALRHCMVQRAEVAKLDLQRRRVHFSADEGVRLKPVEADHLILALGSTTNLRAVPGMMEHGLFLKTLADALGIREHIIKRLEEADLESDPDLRRALLHFVVVGGGYSGVETAGEILDLLHDARRFYPSFDPSELRVTLVHSGPYLLPELGEDLGSFAQQSLESRGMTIMLNRRASSVSASYIRLSDGTRLDSLNPICTIGNAPNPVLADLAAEYDKGWLVTDEYLRLKGYTHVWGIGDGASNPDGYGHQAPPTAQFAIQLGRHASENIASSISGHSLRPFRYKMMGQMATIGHHKGVCSIFGFRFSGFLAWWLTRTIHLLKLPGLDRKLRVMMDWTFELFFPPDLNYLDLKKTQKIARMHVEPGDVIFRQGEHGSAFYVVEEGSLEAVRRNEESDVLWRDELIPGDHFGEGSFLYGVVRQVTITAKTPATLMVFNSKEFKSFVSSFQSLSQILRYTAQRGPQEEVLGESRWSADLLSSPVESVMKTPAPCLPSSASINDAIIAFGKCAHTLLCIMDGERKLLSIVTKTDVYRAMTHDQDFREPIHAIAKREVATVHKGQAIREALGVLYMKDVKQAPVLDDQSRPVGILSHMDIAEARIHLEHPASDRRHASSVDTPE